MLTLWALLPRPPSTSVGSLKPRCMCDVAILQPQFAVDGVVLAGRRGKWWWEAAVSTVVVVV
jgi:hypothetical protein